jgi:hypothetical protein
VNITTVVLNADFDDRRYLSTLEADGLKLYAAVRRHLQNERSFGTAARKNSRKARHSNGESRCV